MLIIKGVLGNRYQVWGVGMVSGNYAETFRLKDVYYRDNLKFSREVKKRCCDCHVYHKIPYSLSMVKLLKPLISFLKCLPEEDCLLTYGIT